MGLYNPIRISIMSDIPSFHVFTEASLAFVSAALALGLPARDAPESAIIIPPPAVSTKTSKYLIRNKPSGKRVFGLSQRCGQMKPSLVAVTYLSA